LRFLPIALVALAVIGALILGLGRHSATAVPPMTDVEAIIVPVTAPATVPPGDDFTVTVEGVVINNGPGPDEVDLTVTLSAEVDCTLVPPAPQTEALSPVAPGETRPVSKSWTVNCTAPTVHHFTAEICAFPRTLPDPNLTDNCDSDDFQVVIGTASVGGEVELHRDGNSPAAASGSGSSSDYALLIAAAVAGAIVVLAASGWYARRRWLR
jgi:hypothetical protein